MNRLCLSHRHIVLVVAMLLLVASSAHVGSAQVLQGTTPSLITAAPMANSPGTVSVTGQDFTPGGEVFIALYDRWGARQYETRRVTASVAFYGQNGSQDPALGYTRGGAINEIFGSTETVYGPNGSQDPAIGYVPGVDIANLCGASLMVRAYDSQTDAWSNVLDLELAC